MSNYTKQLVQNLMRVRQEIKTLQKEEDTLRSVVVEDAIEEWEDRQDLLPTTTISIPDEFWDKTGFVSVFDFVESRFPTWDLIDSHEDHGALTTILILRKRPEFMPFLFEDDDVKLSKVAVEATPEIDEETLKAERPDLYNKIFTPVTVMQLNEEELQKAIEEDPEVPSILMRHQFTKRAPQQRISAKEVTE